MLKPEGKLVPKSTCCTLWLECDCMFAHPDLEWVPSNPLVFLRMAFDLHLDWCLAAESAERELAGSCPTWKIWWPGLILLGMEPIGLIDGSLMFTSTSEVQVVGSDHSIISIHFLLFWEDLVIINWSHRNVASPMPRRVRRLGSAAQVALVQLHILDGAKTSTAWTLGFGCRISSSLT